MPSLSAAEQIRALIARAFVGAAECANCWYGEISMLILGSATSSHLRTKIPEYEHQAE